MRNRYLSFLLLCVLLAMPVWSMEDSNHSVTADTDGLAVIFNMRCTQTWIKNDGSVSVYVKWYKAGEAIPATDTGGLEVKAGEAFARSSSLGGLEFIGVTVRSASATSAVRVFGGLS